MIFCIYVSWLSPSRKGWSYTFYFDNRMIDTSIWDKDEIYNKIFSSRMGKRLWMPPSMMGKTVERHCMDMSSLVFNEYEIHTDSRNQRIEPSDSRNHWIVYVIFACSIIECTKVLVFWVSFIVWIVCYCFISMYVLFLVLNFGGYDGWNIFLSYWE